MDQQNPKQQIVENLKAAENVLVTVSSDPSIDQLAAAIGTALMLDKIGKHATAVFSGKTPNAIQFLDPDANLHKNTDSLQDFIIALDTEKADKLRFKREGNIAKIFITPFKSSITQDDLRFSQGEVNVDAVLALGVDRREHLDQAITAHGRILHNAKVMSVMAGKASSEVGSVNWQDSSASSLSEMVVSISEAFQSGLLDAQMANAFLTGIVSETDRFKNSKTTPKVMTMSAQLMSAGANQQLIADNLAIEEPEPEPELEPEKPEKVEEPENSSEQPVDPPKPQAPETKMAKQPAGKKKGSDNGDVLTFNMHDLDGDVSYDGQPEEPDDPKDPKEHDPDKIDIDKDGNIQTMEEEQAQVASAIVGVDSVAGNQPKQGSSNQANSGDLEEPESSLKTRSGMKVIKPLPPEDTSSNDDKTLQQIEQNLNAHQEPDQYQSQQAVIESASPDEARQNIQQALNRDQPNQPLPPVEDLNAKPLPEGSEQDLHPDQSAPPADQNPSVNSTAPPLPPPPTNPAA